MTNYRVKDPQGFLKAVMTVFGTTDGKIDSNATTNKATEVKALLDAERKVVEKIILITDENPNPNIDDNWIEEFKGLLEAVNKALAQLKSSLSRNLSINIGELVNSIKVGLLTELAAPSLAQASTSSASAAGVDATQSLPPQKATSSSTATSASATFQAPRPLPPRSSGATFGQAVSTVPARVATVGGGGGGASSRPFAAATTTVSSSTPAPALNVTHTLPPRPPAPSAAFTSPSFVRPVGGGGGGGASSTYRLSTDTKPPVQPRPVSAASASASRNALFQQASQPSGLQEVIEANMVSSISEKSPDETLVAGEILLNLHSPNRLPSKNKVVVTLLDASGSMAGERWETAIGVSSSMFQGLADNNWGGFQLACILPFGCNSFESAQTSSSALPTGEIPRQLPFPKSSMSGSSASPHDTIIPMRRVIAPSAPSMSVVSSTHGTIIPMGRGIAPSASSMSVVSSASPHGTIGPMRGGGASSSLGGSVSYGLGGSADPGKKPVEVKLNSRNALNRITEYLRDLKGSAPTYDTYLVPALKYIKKYFQGQPDADGEKPELTLLVDTDGAINEHLSMSSSVEKEQFLLEVLKREGLFDICSSISVVFVQIAGASDLVLCTKYNLEQERYFAETMTISSLDEAELSRVTESAMHVLGAEKTTKPVTLRFTQGTQVLETLQLGVLPLDMDFPVHFSLPGIQSNAPIKVEVFHGADLISTEDMAVDLDAANALGSNFVHSIGEEGARFQREPSDKKKAAKLVSSAVKAGNIPASADDQKELDKLKIVIEAELRRCEPQLKKEDVRELQGKIPLNFRGEVALYLEELSLRQTGNLNSALARPQGNLGSGLPRQLQQSPGSQGPSRQAHSTLDGLRSVQSYGTTSITSSNRNVGGSILNHQPS